MPGDTGPLGFETNRKTTMIAALIDFETTGLDSTIANPIDVSVVFTDEKWNILKPEYQSLIWDSSYKDLEDKVVEITGLTTARLKAEGRPTKQVFTEMGSLFEEIKPDYFVAYNAPYDSNIISYTQKRFGLSEIKGISLAVERQWLCAMNHIPKVRDMSSRKLSHVALDMGLPVDPSTLHRASGDVELMRKMLIISGIDANAMHINKNKKMAYLIARTRKPWEDGGASNEAAKALGFGWQKARGDATDRMFLQKWVRIIEEELVDDFIQRHQHVKIVRIA